MPADPVRRRLAAILAADVAGYSRLMGQDEEGTLAALTAHRTELIEPCIAEHRGRIVKTTGDGLLVEFASVVDAIRCAVAFQEGMAERNADSPNDRRIEFRIGVNLGDVMLQDDDVYGDGVNVAARLEEMAEPGGMVISASVYDQIKGKISLVFDDLGAREVKNIAEPIRAYGVAMARSPQSVAGRPLSLPDKPSIAVLPFQNMSGDPEQEYFADGVTEDLITALSRIRQFFVIARNTTFTYKGQAVDVQSVAKELGVRYVLEGSVRKAGNRVRITAQLIDGATGNHIWAERYDRELEDIFALHDELSLTLVAAIEPELAKAERRRAGSKKPDNLDAWDCYHRGMWLWQTMKKDEIAEARRLFEQAVQLDPNFAPAYAGYATTYFQETRLGYAEGNKAEAVKAARRAVALDGEDAQSHLALGMLHYVDREMDAAVDEFEFAIQLNPSLAMARVMLGRTLIGIGRAEDAIAQIQEALRLSPRDPTIGPFYAALGRAYLCLGKHEEALKWTRLGQRQQNIAWALPMVLASAFGHLDRENEARAAIQEMQRLRPGINIGFVQKHLPINDSAYMDHLLDGLRKAGLPE